MVLYYAIALPSQNGGEEYGILGKETDSYGNTLQSVVFTDISCNKEWIANLAELCTDGQLALEQLYDVIYDALP